MPNDVTPYVYCLFQQPWWLDAVAPGAWDAVEVDDGHKVLGRFVFSRERRLGLRILTQPPLTQFCGPWIRPFNGKPAARAAQEDRVLDRLIAALPPHDVFRQCFHYAVTRWLPFYWAGFRQTTRLSYVIDDLSDLDRLWTGLRTDVRTAIRKAQQQLTVDSDGDVETLIELATATFRRQGLDLPYTADLVRRLDEACAARGQRGILIARDGRGRPCAANMVVWDEDSAHGLISGFTGADGSVGAASLMIWEAIKLAQKVSRRFDFEGSIIRGIEHFLRGFGGRPTPYPQLIGGQTMAGSLALAAGDLLVDRRRRLRDAR